MFQPSAPPASLGADLRALRRSRGITLQTLAARLGRSVGWISQVERDLSHPSIDDLRAFAGAFDVPLSIFFGQCATRAGEDGRVVRAGARRRIGAEGAALVEELLSPDLTDEFEMVHSTFQPGASLPAPQQRPTTEVGYIVSGRLDMTIGGQDFTLDPGDSFRIKGEPFRWANPYDRPAVAIWVIAPPVY
ncbi:XRE family transcriptional regulator [Maritimibacter sp. 55A14]|uniref:helix-turn-helix domain-containing protein n=1 Tax=Maritimibacter sp. 55A14 TaxID=2174844 RepID=UPI000D6153E8|nr:cupin domain-containing protein [Maritimibacter sp. 55A14]PWE29320.1 XRE family transcriptional regulator [Maritimibacter sp. 55A14]